MKTKTRVIRLWIGLLIIVLTIAGATAQELVYSTGVEVSAGGPGLLVVLGDLANDLSDPAPYYVAPYFAPTQAALINPHGFALVSRDQAVAAHIGTNLVDIIDIPTASLTGSFSLGASYGAYGSVAINPAGTHVLLASGYPGNNPNGLKLFVVPTPLSSSSTASAIVTLPGYVGTAQTHAITFDRDSGRAYVGHNLGITAIDPPYDASAVAFTIALPAQWDAGHNGSYAVELSPDKSTLLASHIYAYVLHAPFSASSVPEELVIPGASVPDGVSFLPDGSKALIVDVNGQDALGARVYAVSAPFSASSIVEPLLLPTGLSPNGFEDIAISPDGQYAALAGQGGMRDPLVILRAPFTAGGFTAYAVQLRGVGGSYGSPGRGPGTAHFWTQPATLSQVTIDRISVTEGDSGMRPATFAVTLSSPATQTVSVDYATSDGTAHAGIDYQAISGTLTFAPGATRRTVTVPVLGDIAANGNRFFKLLLSNATHASILQEPRYDDTADGACTIIDDDGGVYIITDSPLPDATVGVPYSVTFTVGNDPGTSTWSFQSELSSVPPPGLSFDSVSGVLSGTPTMPTPIPYYFTLAYHAFPFDATREYQLRIRADRIFDDGFEAVDIVVPSAEGAKPPTRPERAGGVISDPTRISLPR